MDTDSTHDPHDVPGTYTEDWTFFSPSPFSSPFFTGCDGDGSGMDGQICAAASDWQAVMAACETCGYVEAYLETAEVYDTDTDDDFGQTYLTEINSKGGNKGRNSKQRTQGRF